MWASCECAKEQKQLVSVLSHHFLRLLLSPSLLMACFLSDFLTRAPTTSCLKHTHTHKHHKEREDDFYKHTLFSMMPPKNYQLPFNNWAAAKQRYPFRPLSFFIGIFRKINLNAFPLFLSIANLIRTHLSYISLRNYERRCTYSCKACTFLTAGKSSLCNQFLFGGS